VPWPQINADYADRKINRKSSHDLHGSTGFDTGLEWPTQALPNETVVVPGHGPLTTIGEERESNSFLRK
jgi:hypothetical protein